VVLLAVKVGDVAWPEESVIAVALEDPTNNPLGPEEGAAKVTVTPAIGLPVRPSTVATKALGNDVLTFVI
jgi:hypothetical protein